MLHSWKMFRISLIILALGLGLWHWRQQQAKSAAVKAVELYWQETGLQSSELEDLIDDDTCKSSERYFLACANALTTVGHRYNLQISPTEALQPQLKFTQNSLEQGMSEKKSLQIWKDFYKNSPELVAKINFIQVWKELLKNHVPAEHLSMIVGAGLNGFISVFKDPHTYLLPIAMFRDVISRVDSKSASLGIILGRTEKNYFIRKVYQGAITEKAGVKKGDILLAVNDQPIANLMPARVSELLKGEVGQSVRLSVVRDEKKIEFTIIREQSAVPTVSAKIIDGIKPVGIITLNKFAKKTCEKTKEVLSQLVAQRVRGLMLDLRDNPGGQMEEAACIASLFVGPEQKIFDIRYLDLTKPIEANFGSEAQLYRGPLAILVNNGSASASEIVAGALQDLGRAVLVGEKTFGKGSFQEGEVWGHNEKIALFETKGFYYLPSGRSPQLKGLEPDVKVAFKDTLPMSEVDQYVNPLEAPKHISLASDLTASTSIKSVPRRQGISMQNCLEIEDSNLSAEDPQLGQARMALFCAPKVAGANP